MLNVVAIMGRLVADPELRTTQQGTNVCSFRIACDRNFARQGEQRQADFIDIVAWRQQAEFVSKYSQKGSLIAIEGSLQTRQYQDTTMLRLASNTGLSPSVASLSRLFFSQEFLQRRGPTTPSMP